MADKQKIPVEVDTPKGKRRFPSARAAAKAYGLSDATIRYRLKSGWSTRQALELDPPPKRKSPPTKLSPEERKARRAAVYRAWTAKNREHVRQYSRKYYAQRMQDSEFRDHHNARTALWRERNPEKVRSFYARNWRNMNEEQKTQRKRNKNRQYHADGERSRRQQREWRVTNHAWAIERQRAYLARATPEQIARNKECRRRWRIENKEKKRESSKTPQAKETRRRYLRKQWRTNPQHKLGLVLRNRLNNVLKGRVKKGSAVKFLRCTIKQLRKHLESLFIDGMTWDNWGQGPGTWQIDHVVPIALHDITDPEQLAIVCHWSNLMPIWDEVHKRKTAVDTANIRESRKK